MFGKSHHQGKRSPNILFVLFRLVLSMVMFVVLLGGIYTAYKHFSGIDPLKLDPQAIIKNVLAARTPQQLIGVISSIEIGSPTSQQVLGKSAQPENPFSPEVSTQTEVRIPAFRFLLIADSHNDNNDLKKAINQAKQIYPDIAFIIGLGDYTTVGTVDELKQAKKELDDSSLRYFLVAGDHDMWDSRDKQMPAATNFNQVFGPLYQSFDFGNFRFLLLDNSDDYKGFGDAQLEWIDAELGKIQEQPPGGVFVFLHEPLFHPSSTRVMGKIEKDLKQQARDLMFQLKSVGVRKVFAGDIHFFSEYKEPVTDLEMVTIGAVAIERNPQAPRFAVVSVYDDGATKVDDMEIK